MTKTFMRSRDLRSRSSERSSLSPKVLRTSGSLDKLSILSRCVARTFSIEEAKQISDRFEAQGYEINIVENKRGSTAIYEVWAGKRAEGFEVKGNKDRIGSKILKTD